MHPASCEDPTCKGSRGTEALRGSKDPHNSALTFSVVYRVRRLGRLVGVETLDLECESESQYFMLLRGFTLLIKKPSDESEPSSLSSLTLASEAVRRLERSWTYKKVVPPAADRADDPVTKLYESSGNFDPWKLAGIAVLQEQELGPTLPPERFLGWTSAGTQIWARLHMAGLIVRCVYSWDLERVILEVRCPQWRLEEMAERMHMKLRRRNGKLRRFRISHRDEFAETSNGTLFTSGERQQIIDRIVRSRIRDGGAELGEYTELGRHILQSFPLHKKSSLLSIRHSWVTFWRQGGVGKMPRPWSLWETPWRESSVMFSESVKRISSHLLMQPLDNIAEYFGEGVGFLYAYMAFYTRWLITPSLFGVVVFCFQLKDRTLDHPLCIPFAVFNMLWVSFMLTYWRQKQSILAYRWGVLDYEMDETERPQFVGEERYDQDTAEMKKVFPTWRRALRYILTVPMQLTVMAVILVIMFTIFSTQSRLLQEYSAGARSFNLSPFIGVTSMSVSVPVVHTITLASSSVGSESTNSTTPAAASFTISDASDGTFWLIALMYPTLYGVIITVSTFMFDLLAVHLNNFENHRTQSTFLNRLILKVFSFRFIIVFTSLYWYAFSPYVSGGDAYIRVAVVVFCMLTVASWGEAFLSVYLPSLVQRVATYNERQQISSANRLLYRAKEFDDANGRSKQDIINTRERLLEQARSPIWQECHQMSYTTYADYAALIVQLGLILLFSPVFPLSPLIALLNNLFMLRLRAYKVCYTTQRPLSHKSSGIGVWEDILQIMSVIGVLTNLALFGITSDVLKQYLQFLGGVGIAILLFISEHAVLLFKYWLHTSVPRIPLSILRLQERERMGSQAMRIEMRRQTNGENNNLGDGAEQVLPLLAPLDDLMDRSQYMDVDEVNSNESKNQDTIASRSRKSVTWDSKLIFKKPRESHSGDKENSRNYCDDESDELSSVDSLGSDSYHPAMDESDGTMNAAESRLSIGSRLRDFQVTRHERERNVLEAMEAGRDTRMESSERELVDDGMFSIASFAEASRQSILSFFGWAPSADDDAPDVAPNVKNLTLEEKLNDVEKLRRDNFQSEDTTHTPLKPCANEVVKSTPIGFSVNAKPSIKSNPKHENRKIPRLGATIKTQVTSQPTTLSERDQMKKRLEEMKKDRLKVNVPSGNEKRPLPENPFSFAQNRPLNKFK